MLNWFHKKQGLMRKTLITLVTGWLFAAAAPCVMAAIACVPYNTHSCATSIDGQVVLTDTCDTVTTFDCSLPIKNTSPSVEFDNASNAPLYKVFVTTPIATYLPEATGIRRHTQDTALFVHPPLNLKHAVLLI